MSKIHHLLTVPREIRDEIYSWILVSLSGVTMWTDEYRQRVRLRRSLFTDSTMEVGDTKILFEVLVKFEGLGKMQGWKILKEEEASKVGETYGCDLEEKMKSMSEQVVKLVMENSKFSPRM